MEERKQNDVRTALVAIAKNEGPYIREWVVYHKKICGFGEILVYENDSTDETRRELEDMAAEGLCQWKPWPRSEHNPPQPKAYWDSLNRKGDWDWMCLMDVDEFLVIRSGQSVADFVSGFDDKTGSIAFNWVIFYSTDKKKSNRPVTERVKCCYGDSHVKTIARTEAITTSGIHGFWLKDGYRYMHCSGREYSLGGRADELLESNICKNPDVMICDVGEAQINHYMMKSEEEVAIRDERGDACRRAHVRKRTMASYKRILSRSDHRENHSIERYIDARYGLERFYEELAAG